MWLVSRVGWNIQPRNVHLMNHSERRCSLILVCRRHSTSRVLDFCRFDSASLLWQQHEGKIQNKHIFSIWITCFLFLKWPRKTDSCFFFFLVSSRISQQRSVSGLALLCVRNVRSSQDLAALWDYSAEQEKHERVSLLSEPREAFHPRMSNKHPPCLSVSRVWFPCVVPFSSVSQRFLCCCFVAL